MTVEMNQGTTTVQASVIDDMHLNTLYALLEGCDQDSSVFTLSKEQYTLLDKEHALHVAGKTKSYSLEEAIAIIRGN